MQIDEESLGEVNVDVEEPRNTLTAQKKVMCVWNFWQG